MNCVVTDASGSFLSVSAGRVPDTTNHFCPDKRATLQPVPVSSQSSGHVLRGFGNEIQRIHHRHEPPSDTPSPEVRRMSCFRICPTLALFAFIPGMMIKPGFGIIRMFLQQSVNCFTALINPFGFVELAPYCARKGDAIYKPSSQI